MSGHLFACSGSHGHSLDQIGKDKLNLIGWKHSQLFIGQMATWTLAHSVQVSGSVVSDSMTPWTAAHQASLSFTNSQSLLKLMSIESAMPLNYFILCRSLLLLPSIFPSIRVFSNQSALHVRWPKYWSFSINISPSNEHSGLISFRVDWLDLLAVPWQPQVCSQCLWVETAPLHK